MSEIVSIAPLRRREAPRPGGGQGRGAADFFDRRELDLILQVYSRKVMAGEWVDYAIGCDERGAVFEIYGHANGLPLYNIWKRPKSDRRAGRYQLGSRGRLLKTDQSLGAVLKLLEGARLRLVDR